MTEAKKSRVTKVVLVDKDLSPVAAATTAQQPDDPFTYGGVKGLQEPPYIPDQLNKLAEQHSTHGAALEQKTADVVGGGWEWEKLKDEAEEDEAIELENWLRGLADPEADESFSEILTAAWLDVETLGYGGIELARSSEGKLEKIFSIPAHTFRFHKDGVRIAQGPTGKRTWFKRWVPEDSRIISKTTGELYDDRSQLPQDEEAGNEILILRRPTRRKSWYGVPGYVSALGWIYLGMAAREDNIKFFQNRREPRWAVVLKNIEDDDGKLEDMLREAFTTSLADPHRNIFIPIEGEAGDIKFQKMTEDSKDISFDKLQERVDNSILLAHRIPPDRLGAVRVGPLGGNATMAASRVYKEGVVSTSQTFLSERMNRFIQVEHGAAMWRWKPTELDLTEEAEDTATITNAWINGIMKLDEARKKLKLPLVGGDEGEMFFHQFTAGSDQQGVMAANNAARSGAQLGALVSGRRRALGGVQASADPAALIRDVDTAVRAALLARNDESEESGGSSGSWMFADEN
jgi:PBSX family phage portal protein